MAVNNLLKGTHPDIINANVQTLKNAGYGHANALRCAMCHANKKIAPTLTRVAKTVVKKSPLKVKIAPTPLSLR